MVLLYFLGLLLLATFLVGRLLWPFVAILILSYLLATIFSPVYTFFNRKFSSQFSSLFTCGLIGVLIFLPMTFFVGTLSQEAYALFQLTKGTNLALKFTEFVEQNAILLKLKGVIEGYGIKVELKEFGAELSDLGRMSALFIYNQASAWAANILNFVFDFIMMILVIFFLLIDQEKLKNYLQRLSPLPDHHDRLLLAKFEEISRAILIGNGICGVIQGVLGGLVFAFMGINSPVLWGAIMGILAFLPIVGIGLVLLPASLILLLKGKIAAGVLMAVFYVFLSFSVEYIVKPQMVGERVKMHTLLVFLSILGGLKVFGFLGIIYGPLIVTGFLTLVDIYFGSYDVWVKSPGYWKSDSHKE
ncbi:MAG: AI-2E family transporter [Desulfobulbaceae bacterium]|uniref:AI-2E family transporter n=1 Tax=Candidatus Desulfobia pelagia TaxID=2841692 RepID=A0A8J6NHT5_9BACT|nr:AI-2E family transporter [Candidatus Desulfobia pelagia]